MNSHKRSLTAVFFEMLPAKKWASMTGTMLISVSVEMIFLASSGLRMLPKALKATSSESNAEGLITSSMTTFTSSSVTALDERIEENVKYLMAGSMILDCFQPSKKVSAICLTSGT
ncbi:hypothetical protein CJJ07_000293 [Candidozyma auris]|nr:hypothetical protein CJJ07_000293 [[Candida] auris]QEL61974.1 hypothetical protein CJJ09_004138 [[Candida] auris]